LPEGSITISGAAAETLLEELGIAGGSITVSIQQVTDKSSLTGEQIEAVGGRPVFALSIEVNGVKISEFGGPVEVQLPYAPLDGEDPNKIVIFYVGADGGLKMIPNGRYDAETETVIFVTDHFSHYMIGYIEITPFSDIAESYWGADAVMWSAARGLVHGRGDGTYDPEGAITRAEFTRLLTNMIGALPQDRSIAPVYTDVEFGMWFYDDISAAKSAGLLEGLEKEDGSFNPNEKITRTEMALVLANLADYLNVKPIRNAPVFTDISGPENADKIMRAVNAGFLNGNADGTFAPFGNMTRAQAAQLQKNVLIAIYRLD
jgi:hypothetical protein